MRLPPLISVGDEDHREAFNALSQRFNLPADLCSEVPERMGLTDSDPRKKLL